MSVSATSFSPATPYGPPHYTSPPGEEGNRRADCDYDAGAGNDRYSTQHDRAAQLPTAQRLAVFHNERNQPNSVNLYGL